MNSHWVSRAAKIAAIAALSTSLGFAQSIVGLAPTQPGSIQNQIALATRHAAYRALTSTQRLSAPRGCFYGRYGDFTVR